MDLPEAEFDKVHNIDAKGIFLSMKEELRVMTAQEPLAFGDYKPPRPSRGVIVNVSSRAGLEGVATFSAYCSAKHAVIGLTKACSLEHAEDMIRINAICPGLITTPGHTSDPTHSELDAKVSGVVRAVLSRSTDFFHPRFPAFFKLANETLGPSWRMRRRHLLLGQPSKQLYDGCRTRGRRRCGCEESMRFADAESKASHSARIVTDSPN